MKWLKTFLKWRLIRVLQVWNLQPVRAQGGILALIPIAAVIVSFLFAIYGNNSRGWIQYDIQRRFRLVRQYNDLLTLMVNAETGERGYILTGKTEYLEPYQKAVNDIPQAISAVRQTIEEEPGEKPRVERLNSLNKVENLINQQLASLKTSQNFVGENKSPDELSAQLDTGKNLMDQIRAELNEMSARDAEILDDRIEDINTIRKRDYIMLFVALLVGLIARLVSFYLFDRGIVRRIERLRNFVAATLKGEATTFVGSKKTDAIGMLEEEVLKLAEQKDQTRVSQN